MSCSLIFQRQVANSKQFPFRFFTAYEVLSSLEKEYEETRKFMSQSNSYYSSMCLCHSQTRKNTSQSNACVYITIIIMSMKSNLMKYFNLRFISTCMSQSYYFVYVTIRLKLYHSQAHKNMSQTNEYMSQLNWRVFATIRFTNMCQLCVQLDFYTLKS